MTKGAVIGFPIQMMARVISGGLEAYAGASSTVQHGIQTIAKAATGLALVGSLVSNINDKIGDDANRDAIDLASLAKQFITNLITFVDMNATVISIKERRRIAQIDVPGKEGDYIQNLGGKSADYVVTGRFYRVDPKAGTPQSPFSGIFYNMFDNVAVGQVQLLTVLARTGIPVPFMCEYGMAEVIIKEFNIIVPEGQPQYVNYTISMVEYRRLPTLLKMVGLAALNVVDK